MTSRSCPKAVAEVRSPAHLAWIRALPCAVKRCRSRGDRHAHHVRVGTGGGTGLKPSDRWCVSLCAVHHAEGHQCGWRTFEAKYGVDLRWLAQELAAVSPHLKKPVLIEERDD